MTTTAESSVGICPVCRQPYPIEVQRRVLRVHHDRRVQAVYQRAVCAGSGMPAVVPS